MSGPQEIDVQCECGNWLETDTSGRLSCDCGAEYVLNVTQLTPPDKS